MKGSRAKANHVSHEVDVKEVGAEGGALGSGSDAVPEPLSRGVLASVFGLALALRLTYLWQAWRHPAIRLPVIDAAAYRDRALAILDGDWLGGAVYYLDPLYPFFLALVYAIVPPDSIGALVAQALLDSVSVVLIALIAGRVFDARTALVAGLLAASYRPFLYYDALLLKAPLMIFLIVLALYLVTRAAATERPGSWLGAGILLGLAALTRGNSLLFVPVLGLWLLGFGRGDLRRRVLCGLALGIGVAGAILPVSIRNYVVGDDLVLLNSQGGQNFYIGHFEGNDTGVYRAPPFLRPNPAFEEADFAAEARRRAGRAMKPSEISSFWLGEGLDEIRQDPARFVRHSARKVLVLLNEYEVPDNASYDYFRREVGGVLTWPLASYALVLPLSVGGFLLARRRPLAVVLGLFVVSYSAGILLFFNLSRLRLPIVPVLIVFSAHALVAGGAIARAGPRRALMIPALAVLVMLPLSQLDLGRQSLNVRYVNMGIGFIAESEVRWQAGEDARASGDEAAAESAYAASFAYRTDAEEQFELSLALDPEYIRARRGLRRSRMTRVILLDHLGRDEAALESAHRLAADFPDFPTAQMLLGKAQHKAGDVASARRAFQRALHLQPGHLEARRWLERLDRLAPSASDPGPAPLSELRDTGGALEADPTSRSEP